ncbi:hypothetical protein [Streptomyces sp. CBMA29]|uniref:hypothetical protein n=1 Tax=Streptomyces sp. CBMA29 TaxID=1896314 RepID=UPI001661CB2B|nr:hypothetical protein [Streptomyces sp. CBMA29]
MHMRIVGQHLWVEVLEHGAQLYKDGRPFSFPITHGEAGIYAPRDQPWYTYREIPDATTTPYPNGSDAVEPKGWNFLKCGCVVFVTRCWVVNSETPNTVECAESQRLHAAYATAANRPGPFNTDKEMRALDEHWGVPEKRILAGEERARKIRERQVG